MQAIACIFASFELTSFSIILSKSTHVVENGKIPFCFYDWVVLFHCVYMCVCVYTCEGKSQPNTSHLLYPFICWGTNNAAMNVGVHSVQLLSCVRLFATPWTAARQASLSITNSRSLLKLMSIESVMPSNHLILCCPLLLLPSVGVHVSFQISIFVSFRYIPRGGIAGSYGSIIFSLVFFFFLQKPINCFP